MLSALAVFPEIVYVDFHQAFLYGAAYNGMAQRTFKEFRDDRDYVNSHNKMFQIDFSSCKNNILM